MPMRTVVFDMDGTLVQARAASWDVFQDTARRFELPVRSAEEFFELFRGNFYESLASLCGDAEFEARVRQHFLQGLRDRYSPHFIPGMRDVVKTLAAQHPLAVMSSNAMSAIRRILESERVAECFAHVFSGEVGGNKEAHLRQILDEPSYGNARHCSPSYVEGEEPDAADVVLITDTVGDVREARNCGARAIGVAWGMHSSEALLEAGAESVALWPQELLATLLPEGDNGCRCGVPDRAAAAAVPSTDDGAGRRRSAWAAATAAGHQRRTGRMTTGAAGAGWIPPALPAPALPTGPDPVLVAALARIAPPPP